MQTGAANRRALEAFFRIKPPQEPAVLKDRNSSAIVAVKDLDRAKAFYADTLGLDLVDAGPDEGEVLVFETGATRLMVYVSEFAGTNRANAVVWGMDGDLVDTVKALKAKGVVFEHYDMPGVTLNGDIHEAGTPDRPMKMVWFKDPDGNILHINEGM